MSYIKQKSRENCRSISESALALSFMYSAMYKFRSKNSQKPQPHTKLQLTFIIPATVTTTRQPRLASNLQSFMLVMVENKMPGKCIRQDRTWVERAANASPRRNFELAMVGFGPNKYYRPELARARIKAARFRRSIGDVCGADELLKLAQITLNEASIPASAASLDDASLLKMVRLWSR